MWAPDPSRRYRAVRDAPLAPEHPYEHALWRILRQEAGDALVAYAHDVFLVAAKREILQAFLLANATDAQVLAHLRVPEDVTRAYRHLFFDTTVFRDELDVLQWVREHPPDAHGPYGEALLHNALMLGVDYLAWMFARGGTSVDPDLVQRQIMADAYFRGRMNRAHALTSREAQMAHQFMSTALKVSRALSQRSPQDFTQLLIKLRYRDDTLRLDEVVKVEDTPLH